MSICGVADELLTSAKIRQYLCDADAQVELMKEHGLRVHPDVPVREELEDVLCQIERLAVRVALADPVGYYFRTSGGAP